MRMELIIFSKRLMRLVLMREEKEADSLTIIDSFRRLMKACVKANGRQLEYKSK